MAYNKIQISREYPYDLTSRLPISLRDTEKLKLTNSIKQGAMGHVNKWRRVLTTLFFSDKNSLNPGAEIKTKEITRGNDTEKQSLRDLENCANAARETEACGQYEWVKTSDE